MTSQPKDDELIERLNAKTVFGTSQAPGQSVNPDGPAAASRIAELKAEREMLIEFVRTYPATKREQYLRPAYQDITSMGTPYTEPAAMEWRDRRTTFADCAKDLRALSNPPSGEVS